MTINISLYALIFPYFILISFNIFYEAIYFIILLYSYLNLIQTIDTFLLLIIKQTFEIIVTTTKIK